MYMEGHCPYDKECSFAHGGEEVRPAADLTKTSICAAWQLGVCPKSTSECLYAHGREDMRKTWAFSKGMEPPKAAAGEPARQVNGQPPNAEEPLQLRTRWCNDSLPPPPPPPDGGSGDAQEAAVWLEGKHGQREAAALPDGLRGSAVQHPEGEGRGERKSSQGEVAAPLRDALQQVPPPPPPEPVEPEYNISWVPLKVTPNMEILLIAL